MGGVHFNTHLLWFAHQQGGHLGATSPPPRRPAQQIGERDTDALASYAQALLQISTGFTATSAALPQLQREARNFPSYGDEYYRPLDLFSAG